MTKKYNGEVRVLSMAHSYVIQVVTYYLFATVREKMTAPVISVIGNGTSKEM